MGLFSRKKKSNSEEPKKQESSQLDEFTQQMSDTAEQCVARFKDRHNLDFSVKSLELIDELLEEASDFYPEMPDGQKKGMIQSFGSYIFEVARRNYGGKYFWYDQGNQPIFVTGQPKFEISLIAFDKVKGRLENGKEDNIPFFFAGYTERVESAKEGDRATIV
ncbi:hypothetical protein K6119_08010 [Paracrocinitomix mangrovi]|uniref:hypothetical protein n=1 Tax=Paracrocinitomix mangrovi TaxID=2862509 RepID=UPI001C8ECFED|nr:hypothetical protein [Paracrocinitomix mangrovi]UKN03456.1 hypothetical protein K6119_08010 [Paracrocinitomix mangrovi]